MLLVFSSVHVARRVLSSRSRAESRDVLRRKVRISRVFGGQMKEGGGGGGRRSMLKLVTAFSSRGRLIGMCAQIPHFLLDILSPTTGS